MGEERGGEKKGKRDSKRFFFHMYSKPTKLELNKRKRGTNPKGHGAWLGTLMGTKK